MPYFQTSDGLNLFFTDHGEGIPILCLSGLTRTHRDFDFVTPHLSGVRLIKMDYRGRGASDWATDHMTYSVPQEGADALALMDHLGLEKAAILGTSRGGLIGMYLSAVAKDRLIGVALNDVGPALEQTGLDLILDYIGRNPKYKTLAEAAADRPNVMAGFDTVPMSRWEEEVAILYDETENGLVNRYDPKLRDAVLASFTQNVDLWPMFDCLSGLPCALIHGLTSNLLSLENAKKMQERMPDLILAHVPDRGHIPFLDEPESLSALHQWIKALVHDL
jgi:pimeloyl-ACP methyl ester carboxylesterase